MIQFSESTTEKKTHVDTCLGNKKCFIFFIPNSIYFPFVLFASRTHTHKHTKEVKFIMKNDSIKVSEKKPYKFPLSTHSIYSNLCFLR